jgi:hypothetical protein
VINWRETLKILTERQKAYKKEIRKPHEVTEVNFKSFSPINHKFLVII